jgi:hypothetical protein
MKEGSPGDRDVVVHAEKVLRVVLGLEAATSPGVAVQEVPRIPARLTGQRVRQMLQHPPVAVHIGVLVYLIARGGSMHERAAGRAQR